VLCLSSYAIDEAKRILSKKFAGTEASVVVFFEDYPYTLIEAPVGDGRPLAQIRDAIDYPVLHAAITAQVDVLLTGDKDFFDVKVDRPVVMAPLDFLAKY
jgi:predicted nucleic acid-binding protein